MPLHHYYCFILNLVLAELFSKSLEVCLLIFNILSVDVSQLTEEEKLEKHENELGTIIDPFEVPAPWVRRTKPNGEVVYVNEETKAVKSKKPGEVGSKHATVQRISDNVYRYRCYFQGVGGQV